MIHSKQPRVLHSVSSGLQHVLLILGLTLSSLARHLLESRRRFPNLLRRSGVLFLQVLSTSIGWSPDQRLESSDIMGSPTTGAVTAVGVLFSIIAILSMAARVYSNRRYQKSIEIDDWLILPAFVSDTEAIIVLLLLTTPP